MYKNNPHRRFAKVALAALFSMAGCGNKSQDDSPPPSMTQIWNGKMPAAPGVATPSTPEDESLTIPQDGTRPIFVTWGDGVAIGIGNYLEQDYAGVRNLGKNGASMANEIQPLPLVSGPPGSVLVISLGGNDVSKLLDKSQEDIDVHVKKITDIAAHAKKTGVTPVIVGLQLPPEQFRTGEPWNQPDYLKRWSGAMSKVNIALQKQAAAAGVAFSPVRGLEDTTYNSTAYYQRMTLNVLADGMVDTKRFRRQSERTPDLKAPSMPPVVLQPKPAAQQPAPPAAVVVPAEAKPAEAAPQKEPSSSVEGTRLPSRDIVSWGDSHAKRTGIALKQVYTSVTNLGVESAGLRASIRPRELGGYRPNSIVLMNIGTNDVAAFIGAGDEKVDAYASELVGIAKKVRADGKSTPVIIGLKPSEKIYDGGGEMWQRPNFLEHWNAALGRMNAKIRERADAEKIPYSPLEGREVERDDDNLHFTITGCLRISNYAFADARVEPSLSGTTVLPEPARPASAPVLLPSPAAP